MRRSLLLVAMVVTALTAGIGVASAADPAAVCGNGAWHGLQTDHGETFKSERACRKYVKHGGVVFNPQVTVVSVCGTSGPFLSLFGTGFHANSLLTLTLDGAIFKSTGTNVKTSQPTDGQGQFVISPDVSNTGPHVTLTVTDAEGVHRTVGTGEQCP
jgi:hypothetical protein